MSESTELIRVVEGQAILAKAAIAEIVRIETALKAAQKEQKAMKEALLAAMEKNGVERLENDALILNYTPESERRSFDESTFAVEFPDIYAEYAGKKVTKVKPSVRINLR